MPTTDINSITTPAGTAQAVTHEDLFLVAEQLARYQMMIFANSSTRTAIFTTLGYSPYKGAISYLQDVRRPEIYDGRIWAPFPGTLLQRGRRTSNSTTTTGEQGVLRTDDLTVYQGHAYRIHTTPLQADTTSANIPGAQVRYTTDGSTPSTGSTVLPGSRAEYRQADGAFAETVNIDTIYVPSADETLSLLLTCIAVTSADSVIIGSSTRTIDLYVTYWGVDPGDTGTDI